MNTFHVVIGTLAVGVGVGVVGFVLQLEAKPSTKTDSQTPVEEPNATALSDDQKALRRLERRLRELEESQPEDRAGEVIYGEEPLADSLQEPEQPALTPEEDQVRVQELQQRYQAEHNLESRDAIWAGQQERTIQEKIESSLGLLKWDEARTEIDCRTTTCLVEVGGEHEEVSKHLTALAMRISPSGCDIEWVSPPPLDAAKESQATIRFDCAKARTSE